MSSETVLTSFPFVPSPRTTSTPQLGISGSAPALSRSSSSTSSGNTPLLTPSFDPNSDPLDVPAWRVSVPALIAASLNLEYDEDDDADEVAAEGSDAKKRAEYTVEDMDLPADIDLSLPISELLRTATARAHVKAENSEGAKALINGTLELEEYIRWLSVLWRLYSALELGLAEHASNPVLAPTYNPAVLARAPKLAQDIAFLLNRLPANVSTARPSSAPVPDLSDNATPLPPFPIPPFLEPVFYYPPPPLKACIGHIAKLSASAATAPALLAHAYVRYLGDLSGGQYIGSRLRKSFKLKDQDGLRFYQFGDEAIESAERRQQLVDLKNWYRRGMDEGVGDDVTLKRRLIKEANLSFMLNTHLFSLIRPTSALMAQMTAFQPGQHDLVGTQERYFDRIEREKAERRARKLIAHPPLPPNTWAQRIEKFFLGGISILLGTVLVAVVMPFLQREALPWLQQHGGHLLQEIDKITGRHR